MINRNKVWEHVNTPITEQEIADLKHNIIECSWMFSDSGSLNFIAPEVLRLINHIDKQDAEIKNLKEEIKFSGPNYYQA